MSSCPDCGKGGMRNVGMHIAQTDCEYPTIPEDRFEHKWEIDDYEKYCSLKTEDYGDDQ